MDPLQSQADCGFTAVVGGQESEGLMRKTRLIAATDNKKGFSTRLNPAVFPLLII